MNRRLAYIIAIVVFVPLIIWKATSSSGLPTVTFAKAVTIADSIPKVLVPGHIVSGKEVKAGEGGLTFYVQDESGRVERVVYDGAEEIPAGKLSTVRDKGESLKLAGHVCSDAEGERFHAKNIYLSN